MSAETQGLNSWGAVHDHAEVGEETYQEVRVEGRSLRGGLPRYRRKPRRRAKNHASEGGSMRSELQGCRRKLRRRVQNHGSEGGSMRSELQGCRRKVWRCAPN